MLGCVGARAASVLPPRARWAPVRVTPTAVSKARLPLERSLSPASTGEVSLFCTVIVQCVTAPLANVRGLHVFVTARPEGAAAGAAPPVTTCGRIPAGCTPVRDPAPAGAAAPAGTGGRARLGPGRRPAELVRHDPQ